MSRLTCLYFESAVSQHPASPLLPVPSFPQLHVSTLAGQFLPLKSCFYDSQASAVFCSTLFGSLDLRQAQKKWLYRRGFSLFESLNTRSPFWLKVNRWLSPWEAGATPGWNWTTMPGWCSKLSSDTRWGFNNVLLLMFNTLVEKLN